MDGILSELKPGKGSSLQLVSKIVKLVIVCKGSHSYAHVIQPMTTSKCGQVVKVVFLAESLRSSQSFEL